MPLAGCNIFPGAPVNLGIQGGADVATPAGTNTTVASLNGANGTVTAQKPGPLIPLVYGSLLVSLGAAPPTALVVTFATTLGTPISSLTVSTLLLLANANIHVPFFLLGVAAQTAWQAGLTPLVYVNPTAQAATVRLNSSSVLFTLLPGGA